MTDKPSEHKPEKIIQQILTLVGHRELSAEEAETVFLRCLSFIRDKKMVEDLANDLGLWLSGFRMNGVLEVYYDMGWRGKKIGCLSKGWEDPGFRISDVIVLGYGQIEMFRQNSDKILNVCATQGVACGVNLVEGEKVQLDLSICIYQDGFNAGTVQAALESFDLCMKRVKSFLSG